MQIFFAAIILFLFLILPNLTIAQSKSSNKTAPIVRSKVNAKNRQALKKIETIIPALMKDAKIPGLALAVMDGGIVSLHEGFGVKNVETKEPVSDKTVFEAASLSKTIFAYAVLKLVEKGTLDLDTPLNKYLPVVYVENDDRINQITARRVLSHTTGFPNWRPKGKPLQIYFNPGERFSYSGEGYVYLQKVVEKLTGLALEDFMKKTVFEPLQMNDSSYIWQQKYDSMKAYSHDSEGNLTGRDEPVVANAAASLHTTVVDYAKFVAAIFERKGIKESTVQEMLRPQVRADESCVICVGRPASGKFAPGINWGLGWGLEDTSDGKAFWHWGDNGDVKAYVVAFEKSKKAIIVFSNSSNGLSIVDKITREMTGIKQPALTWLGVKSY